jgi:aminomethyltransferase
MDEATNPLEADLGWVISKDKKSYVGSQRLASLMQQGPARIRRGIIMDERIPRRDFKVTDKAGEEIGVVTSGTFSPVLKRGIAMGYVKTPSPQLGETVEVVVRDAPSNGKIAKLPFYDDSLYGWKRKPHQQ